jgi:hypothetical protein
VCAWAWDALRSGKGRAMRHEQASFKLLAVAPCNVLIVATCHCAGGNEPMCEEKELTVCILRASILFLLSLRSACILPCTLLQRCALADVVPTSTPSVHRRGIYQTGGSMDEGRQRNKHCERGMRAHTRPVTPNARNALPSCPLDRPSRAFFARVLVHAPRALASLSSICARVRT